MGGYGSGPGGPSRRPVPEDCFLLDALRLAKGEAIVLDEIRSTTVTWTVPRQGSDDDTEQATLLTDTTARSPYAEISYAVEQAPLLSSSPLAGWVQKGLLGPRLRMRLPEPGEAVIRTRFRLSTTRGNFGRYLRWWLHCPDCDARARKLFRPQNREHFACRHCWDLTYRCRLESNMTRKWHQERALMGDERSARVLGWT